MWQEERQDLVGGKGLGLDAKAGSEGLRGGEAPSRCESGWGTGAEAGLCRVTLSKSGCGFVQKELYRCT